MNLKIIGTSHIARESIQEIKKTIEDWKPDLIAVELDIQRAAGLMQDKKNKVSIKEILQIGLRGYLFAKIGSYVQEKLGKMVGVAPGSDMKTAITLAHQYKLKLALIDQPIKITLKRFSQNLTWKEKRRFVFDFCYGLFFPKKQLRTFGIDQFALHKVPKKEIIIKIMAQMKEKYPSVYQTLVEERNKYMVKQLVKLMRENKEQKILAVVGAGHEEGMHKLLLKVDVLN